MPELLRDGQRTEEWFAARKGRITSSLAAACLGIGPDKELSAYNAIMQVNPRTDNAYMRWGTQHEQVAREAYEVVTGNLVQETGFWAHQDHPWLGASTDGLVGTEGLLEIKCPQKVPDAIPEHHEIQCRVEMAVCDRFWCDYFVWTPKEHRLWTIQRDLTREVEILAGLAAFFLAYVQPGVAPPRIKSLLKLP